MEGKSISLSSDSPKWAVIPQWVSWVEIAKYDITSNWDDVTLNSIILKRVWIANDKTVAKIAIYDENWRVTKTKSFNTSDDDATLTFLNWGLKIWAWETRTISVVASIACDANACTTATNNLWTTTINWDRFAVEIASAAAITSNSQECIGDFPVVW